MNCVNLCNVSKTYRLGKVEVPALTGIDLAFTAGQFLTIKGPSGSGKSTLLNIIGLIDSPTEGRLEYFGRDLSGATERELTRYRSEYIGFIFQSFNLIPTLNIAENVAYPLRSRKISFGEQRERVMEMLDAVGLKDLHRRFPNELSGGQRQRAAIARALIRKPAIVLADEPTANLDSETGRMIIELLHKLKYAQGSLIILSTHDPDIISRSDTLYRLKDGRIVTDEGGGE